MLRCAAHNALAAELDFGRAYVVAKRDSPGGVAGRARQDSETLVRAKARTRAEPANG
jgi:hypothetical protein